METHMYGRISMEPGNEMGIPMVTKNDRTSGTDPGQTRPGSTQTRIAEQKINSLGIDLRLILPRETSPQESS